MWNFEIINNLRFQNNSSKTEHLLHSSRVDRIMPKITKVNKKRKDYLKCISRIYQILSQYGGSLDNLLSRRVLYVVARSKGRECGEYKTDHNAYIRYLRCVKGIETLGKELGIATETTGLTSDQEVNIFQGRG